MSRDVRGLDRRNLLALGAGAVVGAGAFGGVDALRGDDDGSGGDDKAAEEQQGADEAEEEPPEIRRFVSTSLTAVAVTTWTADGAEPAPGFIFTTPRTSVFHGLVLDNDGEPVWIEPDGQTVTDLRVQSYRGEPVLTYWSGEVATGTGAGVGHILDTRYRPVATVRASHGVAVDLHEFQLTDRGTALLVGYPVVRHDLSAIGGPADGFVHDNRVQEIDVETGRVLLDWSALEHLDLAESHQEVGKGGTTSDPFDPFHVNSVEAYDDALVLSARHTSALYAIDRGTGEVRWRMGGKQSDFEVPEEAAFASQHDARVHADGSLSLFDNHGQDEEAEGVVSAGLVLEVDEGARTVRLRSALRHDDHFGFAMGNFQVLDGGGSIAGWGTSPSLTEFDAAGRAVFGVDGLGAGTYRSYRAAWTGRPTTDPDIGVLAAADGRLAVHASWNGATEVARWRVLAGERPDALERAATARRTGFETVIEIDGAAHVAVEALGAGGRVLGTSRTLRT